MVDSAGLENRRRETVRGFESYPPRQKCILKVICSGRLTAKPSVSKTETQGSNPCRCAILQVLEWSMELETRKQVGYLWKCCEYAQPTYSWLNFVIDFICPVSQAG